MHPLTSEPSFVQLQRILGGLWLGSGGDIDTTSRINVMLEKHLEIVPVHSQQPVHARNKHHSITKSVLPPWVELGSTQGLSSTTGPIFSDIYADALLC